MLLLFAAVAIAQEESSLVARPHPVSHAASRIPT